MRNLKRALSLVLAVVMVIGLMVVGAGAASLDDFSDKEEIVNQDAVSLLTILGVINGKEDGSYFDPTGNVTRAEMAKMIATILNQGADVDGLYVGMNTGLTDVKGHWAESYINYCYSLGIIAGRGNGKFDPGATVTGNEAAKMLLVAAGYDADIEGLTGPDWGIRTAALASTLGIFDNLTVPTNDPLNRDNAALLIYNALDIEMIQSYQNGYAIAYSDSRTILSAKYGVYRIEGVVVGNEWAALDGASYETAMAAGKTRMDEVRLVDSDTVNTIGNTDDGEYRGLQTLNVATPVEYLGKTVTMYIRNTTVLANAEVLGVYLKDGVNNVVTVNANTEKNTDALKGTGLSVSDDTQYYVNYGYQASQAAALTELGIPTINNLAKYVNVNGVEMEIIDNDDDGIVDYVLYTKEDLTVVSNTSSSKETTTLRGFNENKAIDNEDIVTDMDLAVEDVVLAITYGGRYYVTEPQVVTGKMDAYSSSKLDNQYIEVNSTEYRPSYIGQLTRYETSANGVGDILDFDVTLCEKPTGVQFDNTYEFFLDSNGYVRAFRPTDESAPQYALVLNSGYNPGVYSTDASGKMTLLREDATEGTYEINFSDSAANIGKQLLGASYTKEGGIIELKGFMGTDYTDQSDTRPWLNQSNDYNFAHLSTKSRPTDYKAGQAVGYVIKYTINDSDVVTIQNIIGAIGGYSFHDGYTDQQLADAYNHHTLRTYSDGLYSSYSTGDARVYYSATQSIAVDKNTIAFYFEDDGDGVAEDGEYGVAVGYNNMAGVDANQHFLASTVVNTSYNTTNKSYEYRNTNLADVILFDQADLIIARDYAYVLSANRTASNDQVTLNVLFENGDAGTLVVEKSHFDSIFDTSAKFNRAYAYTTDSKGISTLVDATDSRKTGVAYRIKTGTVGLRSGDVQTDPFYAYDVDKINIWDVTDQAVGQPGSKLSDFSPNDWNAILILDSNKNVRTAFVWEYDGTEPGDDESHIHNFNWSGLNYTPMYSIWGDWATVGQIQDELDAGNNVVLRGDLTIRNAISSLYIPEGRVLRIQGDFDAGSMRVYGGGRLWVEGNYDVGTGTSASKTVEVTTLVGADLILSKDTTLGSLMQVNGDVQNTAFDLGVSRTGDVHVTGDLISVDNLYVDGHLEADNIKVTNGIIVTSVTTLIANGKIEATSLTIGDTSSAGRVVARGNVEVTDLDVTNGTLSQSTGDILTTGGLAVAAKGTMTANRVKVNGTNSKLSGDVTISVLDFSDATVTLETGSKVTLDSYIVDGNSKLIREADSSLTVVEDVDASLPVSGDGLTGSFDSGVSVSENITVPADKATTIAGTLTVASDKKVTVEGDMTLNGGAKLNGSIEIGKEGSLAVNGTDADAPVDVTNITGEAGATVSFAKDAELTGTLTEDDSKFFWKDGTVITDVNDLLGRTFTWKDGSAETRSNDGKGFYADENKPEEPTLDEAMLGTVNSDYTVTRDTRAKTVTVTTETAEDDNVKVSIYAGVGQTIGFTKTENVEQSGSTYTVTLGESSSVSFQVTVSETGKATTTWTIIVKHPTTQAGGGNAR